MEVLSFTVSGSTASPRLVCGTVCVYIRRHPPFLTNMIMPKELLPILFDLFCTVDSDSALKASSMVLQIPAPPSPSVFIPGF